MDIEASYPRERYHDIEEYPYEVLSARKILQHMIDCIKEIKSVFEIPATTTRILLSHFKWDKEKLTERFYDGDQDQLFAQARVINPFKMSDNQGSEVSKQILNNGNEQCEICFTDLSRDMVAGLDCGHRFCKDCWCEYLTNQIMEGGSGQTIACAAHACDILVDDATVMRLVRDPRVKLKYQHIITNSFVECNRLLRWCPSPDCSNAIKVAYVEAAPVTCRCSHTFCFACGENWHDPVRCCLLRKWIKKCNDLPEERRRECVPSVRKECPNCTVTIEKIGGCNHMHCKCGARFCWGCLQWKRVNMFHCICRRYEEDPAMNEERRWAEELRRFLFYCNRYMNHMQSLRFESKLYASVKEKMEELQACGTSLLEVQFLKKAVDILCQCRQTLMYTYVFAYYLRKNNQSVIFEDNQRDLESATETLSEYLERDITSEKDIKQIVQDKYSYCNKRRKVLLEQVHEGYENDSWEYRD